MSDENLGVVRAPHQEMHDVRPDCFIYRVDDQPSGRIHLPYKRLNFAQACDRIIGDSLRAELRTDRQGRAALDVELRRAQVEWGVTDEELEVPGSLRDHLSCQYEEQGRLGDLWRHYERSAAMVHQLLMLAREPIIIFEDYQCWFLDERPGAAEGLKPRNAAYYCLPPEAWPEDPAVPPYIFATAAALYSPCPLEGLVLSGQWRWDFEVPKWFIDDGGWHQVAAPERWR